MAKGKKKIFKRIILPVIILAIIAGGYFYFTGGKETAYNFASVKRADLVQEVSVTGTVKPAQEVDLAFERSGKVSEIYVKVGESVVAGEILAVLDNSELSAKLAQARASLATEEANLDEYLRGTRQEEIAIKEAELEKARQDLKNYYNSAVNVVYDGYNKAEDAVRTQTDEMFANDEDNPVLVFSTAAQTKLNAEAQRKALSDILDAWILEINSTGQDATEEILNPLLSSGRSNLLSARGFLDVMMDAVNNSVSLSQTTVNSYKANVTSARTSVSLAITNINTQEQNIASQKITVQRIQNELDLKLAGKTPEEIAAQEARVRQARANVLDYESQVAKNTLRSPIKGVVTKQNVKVGQIAPANSELISIISQLDFQIETNIPEADIAKIKVSDEAKITLDAYGNDVVFTGRVAEIEPAETVIEGVSTYKATLEFGQEDSRILSGMTANIDIISAEKKNVLVLPYRAVTIKDSGKFVSILHIDGEALIEKKIETGIRGTDGNIEIVSGLNEGEKVVIPE
jgi:HlyD family secretion protein